MVKSVRANASASSAVCPAKVAAAKAVALAMALALVGAVGCTYRPVERDPGSGSGRVVIGPGDECNCTDDYDCSYDAYCDGCACLDYETGNPVVCDEDWDCDADSYCDLGECLPWDDDLTCTVDADCWEDELCASDGYCMYGEQHCQADADCPELFWCEAGVCVCS